MILEFRESFHKDLKKINEKGLLNKVRRFIELAEKAESLSELPEIKKLAGNAYYFRLRLGNYRLGFMSRGKVLIFIRILHRKDIYRYFP